MRRLGVAACAVVVLVLGAHPAGADGDHGGGADACGLLTRKEIAAVMGQEAGKGTAASAPGTCQWRLVETADRAPGQVNAQVIRGADARTQYRLGAKLSPEEHTGVEGLGRKAFFAPGSGTVWVLVDSRTMFYVQANTYDAAANRITDGLEDQLTELSARAVARV